MGLSLTVDVYGCATCPFVPDRVYGKRKCRLDEDVIVRHRNLRREGKPPKDCPLRIGPVEHVLCDENGREL